LQVKIVETEAVDKPRERFPRDQSVEEEQQALRAGNGREVGVEDLSARENRDRYLPRLLRFATLLLCGFREYRSFSGKRTKQPRPSMPVRTFLAGLPFLVLRSTLRALKFRVKTLFDFRSGVQRIRARFAQHNIANV
jgi:hypothetical protein